MILNDRASIPRTGEMGSEEKQKHERYFITELLIMKMEILPRVVENVFAFRGRELVCTPPIVKQKAFDRNAFWRTTDEGDQKKKRWRRNQSKREAAPTTFFSLVPNSRVNIIELTPLESHEHPQAPNEALSRG
jgi:hypothetical protein